MTRAETEEKLLQHMGLVKKALARMLARGVPSYVSQEELFSAGMEGLWHAIERFDETRGLQFSTYAYRCIYGYMQNVVRVVKRERRIPVAWSLDAKLPGTDELIGADLIGYEDGHPELLLAELARVCTPREWQVLQLSYQGYTTREIGRKLGISAYRVYELLCSVRTKARRIA